MAEMVDKLRNIALVGHGGAGKTSLAEVMLFDAGVTNRIGRVEDGNTAMDFEPEELKRSSSISTGLHQLTWKKHTVTLLDTPGDQNFFTDTKLCMEAADGAVFVVDAVDGVRVQTEQGWAFAGDFNMPSAIFINRLDRDRSDFQRTLQDIQENFDTPKPILLQLPIGNVADFKGIVDLITMKAGVYDADGKMAMEDIPADMQEAAEAAREELIENVAEADDALIERYLEGEVLSDDDIKTALRKGTLSRTFVPVLCGSAIANVGINLLMDFIVNVMPSPEDRGSRVGKHPHKDQEVECIPSPDAPFSAFVFKTIADPYAGRLNLFRVVSGKLGSDGTFYNSNKDTKERFNQLLTVLGKEQKPAREAIPGSILAVAKLKETFTGDTLCDDGNKVLFKCAEPLPTLISFAVSAKNKGDEDKVFSSLTKIMEEDLGLKLDRNSQTKEILLSGRGQVHIEVVVEKLKRKFNVEVALNLPKVPYKETIKKKVRVQGRHKKQTGGHGQFGDCWIQMEPMPRGAGFEFVDAIVGGAIPKTYIPAVEKGVIEASEKGILAGFPCVDFRVTVDDGSYHTVDSSEMAFKIAGALAFKKAVEQAKPVLLEPIMNVTVVTPDEYMGDIMGDLNGRRGRVLGMDTEGKNQVIKAQVPLAEFLTYAPDLRSMTGGRGMYTMEFSHYDEVPAQLAEKVIEEANKEKE
ncbi:MULTISPECIES: elongation factor G [Desulfococcus]|uniref:Elongation factor G n=1 Tax=Desulfococcus multivorans DSM 2059 TaxID=1121405 RepID=S7V3A1_DESML|nr:elongation factor G [Desulfococcus multivorans]AOY58960.1 FusA2: elongation factor G (EF-G) [Desulfococcus multivorans]AQV01228.1 elongation factor G [Desulfococcus multivorans]EPR39133.1 translation elongation factor G [Desulfococcus multivorans DSM 2059]SJZ54171.1 translation elongation factor 2 (EF-2/EF-G) [Desulfococcus multivorans DSM 2059]